MKINDLILKSARAETVKDLKIGQIVITPMGRRAEVLGFFDSVDDPFERVKLRYVDMDGVPKKADSVVLQSKLLTIENDS